MQLHNKRPSPIPVSVRQLCLFIPYFHLTIFCIKYHIIRGVCDVHVYRSRSHSLCWMIFAVHVYYTKLKNCSMFVSNGFSRAVERIPWLLRLYQHISLLKHDFNYTDHETLESHWLFLRLQRKTMFLESLLTNSLVQQSLCNLNED